MNSKRTLSFFVLSCATIMGSAFAASPVYVDQSYTREHTNTHIYGVNAFRTIQEGVDAVDRGGIVYVANGIYPEGVTIQKSLSLIGDGTLAKTGASFDAPTIDGRNGSTTILINGTSSPISVIIRNFSIIGGGYGIAVLQNAIMTVDKNTVSRYRKNGITFGSVIFPGYGSISGVINNNTVTGIGSTDVNAQNGIQVAEDNTAVITGNTVTDHVFTKEGKKWATGLLLHQTRGVLVSQNIFKGNQTGINILQGNNNRLTNNTIISSSISNAGIMISNSDNPNYATSNNTIERNTISGGLVGIWTSYVSGNTYSKNILTGMTKNGIFSWDSDMNVITGNTISLIHSVAHDAYAIAFEGGDTTGTIGSENNRVLNNVIRKSDAPLYTATNSKNNSFGGNMSEGKEVSPRK